MVDGVGAVASGPQRRELLDSRVADPGGAGARRGRRSEREREGQRPPSPQSRPEPRDLLFADVADVTEECLGAFEERPFVAQQRSEIRIGGERVHFGVQIVQQTGGLLQCLMDLLSGVALRAKHINGIRHRGHLPGHPSSSRERWLDPPSDGGRGYS